MMSATFQLTLRGKKSNAVLHVNARNHAFNPPLNAGELA